MSDRLASYVRTYWPLFLGHLAALLVAWIARTVGVEVDSALAYEGLSLGASAGVYALGRWLEGRANPVAQSVGRWLLSMGQQIGAPTYGTRPGGPVTPATQYRVGESGPEVVTIKGAVTDPTKESS